jgi:hypothetical protein
MRLGLSRAHLAAFLWGVAEASLFFIVPDVAIGWIALRRGVRAGLAAALLAAAGASLGGAAIYGWSAARPVEAATVIEALPAIPSGAVDSARAELIEGPWVLRAMAGSVRNRPFKLYAAAAPRAGVSLPALVAATPLIRLPRFLANALAFALVGAVLRKRLSPRRTLGLYVGAWTVFYALFWALSPW